MQNEEIDRYLFLAQRAIIEYNDTRVTEIYKNNIKYKIDMKKKNHSLEICNFRISETICQLV